MKNILISSVLLLASLSATSKEKITMSGGADWVSSYICRGTYNAGASVQAAFEMNAKIGAAPWRSLAYLPLNNDGFSVCNVVFAARKALTGSDTFSFPLFPELFFNPATVDIHLIFGVPLRFK